LTEALSRDERISILSSLIHDTEDAIHLTERELTAARARLNRLVVQREALAADPEFSEEVRRIEEDTVLAREEIATLEKALGRSLRALQLYQDMLKALRG
jgi:hypothetical protein